MAESSEHGLRMDFHVTEQLLTNCEATATPTGGDRPMLRLAEGSDRLQVELSRIDSQHKKLFELAASFSSDDDPVRVMKTLAILSDYIRSNFSEEEELMAIWNYPDLKSHCRLHARFRHMLADLFARAGKMPRSEIAEEVKRLINGWFYHIISTDFQYPPCVTRGYDLDQRRSVG